jgi:hypothetical protein
MLVAQLGYPFEQLFLVTYSFLGHCISEGEPMMDNQLLTVVNSNVALRGIERFGGESFAGI